MIICVSKVYQFDGWLFEYSVRIVWPLKVNGDPKKNAGEKFWKMIEKFNDLSVEDKEKHRYLKYEAEQAIKEEAYNARDREYMGSIEK